MTRIELPPSNTSEWDDAHAYLSKSRLVLYHKHCQIKYRKQYVEKCIPYEETHATSIGSRYHNFMELFMAVAEKYPVDQWHTFIHPDFTEEEIPMLKWTIDLEIARYKANPTLWRPIALEYQIVDHEHKLRGIVDRIDQLDDSTINIIEYKTSKSHDKGKLQMEFGFYDLLLDAVPELEGYKRKYTIIYPRFQRVVELNPSRRATTEKRIKDIFDAIENDTFMPACGMDPDTLQFGYKYGYCTICSLEEIAAYNGIKQYLPS